MSQSYTQILPLFPLRRLSSLPRRYQQCLVALPAIATLLYLHITWHNIVIHPPFHILDIRPRPPLFTEYSQEEMNLAQHNPHLPFPEGKHAKFIYHRNHNIRAGWGNILQEMILQATLAQITKRAFVFDDYVWQPNATYANFNGKLIPASIPVLALASGPLFGVVPEPEVDVPRAVSRAYYEQQCPNPTILRTEDILASVSHSTPGRTRLAIWAKRINDIDDRCLELSVDSPAAFDYMVFASTALLDVWPMYSSSSMVANFTYSPLALSAFQRNAHLLFSKPDRIRMKPTAPLTHPQIIDSLLLPQESPLPSTRPRPEPHETTLSALTFTPPPPIPGLLAMHVRRGDFSTHCRTLRKVALPFTAFNSFEGLPDSRWLLPTRFDSSFDEKAVETEEKRVYYARRCFPTIEQIVEKVKKVREEYAAASMDNASVSGGGDMQSRGSGKLSRMYIMTNGSPSWIKKLKTALYAGSGGGWEVGGIVSSKDWEWDLEQKQASRVTDMYIGQRAEVFIGNGFSSLSAHVVMMRMVGGKANITTRHW